MKPEEVRERFSRHYDEEELQRMDDSYLSKLGDMIESLELKGSKGYGNKIRRVLDEIEDSEDPAITKTMLAALLDTSLKTVYKNTPESSNEEIRLGREGGERTYAKADAYEEPKSKKEKTNKLRSDIIETHQEAENILGGYREPTLDEVAYLGDFDPENGIFREVFYELKEEKGWEIPPESKRNIVQSKVKHLMASAKFIEIGHEARAGFTEKGILSAEEYLEKNRKWVEKIEPHGTKKPITGMTLPNKLANMVDSENILEDDFARPHYRDILKKAEESMRESNPELLNLFDEDK